MSLEQSEKEAAAVARTSNRVPLPSIEARIKSERYFTAGEALLAITGQEQSRQHNVFTMCILQMTNGFILVGTSAPADPENFNSELGRKIARDNALRDAWRLEGYLLRENMAPFEPKAEPPTAQSAPDAAPAEGGTTPG